MHSSFVNYHLLGVILFFVSMFVVWMCYPMVLRMSRVWGFMDNPDQRKLQRRPVPVLGGLAVYVGIFFGFMVVNAISFYYKILVILGAMAILLVVGMIDDKCGLPVWLRFLVEISTISAFILIVGNMINNLHGLFGIYELPYWAGFVLSVFAGVGIINSINLIDGVDGYSSAYVMSVCLMFGILFYFAEIHILAVCCFICAGAIVPFFFHNVFGKKTKMFIGDSGTLMMGVLIMSFVFSILKSGSLCLNLEEYHNISLIAATLAALSIPVFDTLRVMSMRIIRGYSPFYPDKTHLHHLFVDLGFSHVGTALMCISLNFLVVLVLIIAWLMGLSINGQVALVFGMGILVTFAFYPFMRWCERKNNVIYRNIRHLAARSHLERSATWHWLTRLVDGDLFDEGRTTDEQ